MRLTLIRHGDALRATAPLGDVGRALSIRGRAQATRTGEALASRDVRPTQIWSSPLVRAVQTAELVAAPLGFGGMIMPRGDLYSHSDPAELRAHIGRLPADSSVIAIGHEPFMSTAAAVLLGVYVGGFETASAYHFEIDPQGSATLRWRWVGRFID